MTSYERVATYVNWFAAVLEDGKALSGSFIRSYRLLSLENVQS